MMISGVSSAFSLSVYRLDAVVTVTAATKPPAAAATSPTDRVTLSADATNGAKAPAEPPDEAAPAPPVAAAPSRADALFAALDADDDGSISEDEFTEGARRLLKRGHRHAHGHDRERDGDRVDGHRHGHHGRHGRLERRLERLFDRVDGNDDGAVDRDELAAALAPRDAEPAPSDGDAATMGTTVAVRVTFVAVSVAVQRYTSVQGTVASEPTAATSAASSHEQPQAA